MTRGQIISGLGHLGLIAWAIFGGAFRSEPLPFEVTEVTAISAEDYAALTAPERAPEALASVDTPAPPDEGKAPVMETPQDAPPAQNRPEATEAPPPDATPAPAPTPPAPPPEAELSDEAPVMTPPATDMAALVPRVSERPKPRPAPRVAPRPVAPPEPDTRIDDIDRQATTPDKTATQAKPQEPPSAREAATTEIVTEAEKPAAAAPSRSPRPRARPVKPPAAEDRSVEDAIAAALGAAGALGQEARPPAGPPLTGGEREALRLAVERCWNVGALSSEALATTVVVAVEMSREGRPQNDSIRMIDFTGGSADAARRAFAAARRAIIRCGLDGYDLPAEKYDRWRSIEMTFNPEKMRIK